MRDQSASRHPRKRRSVRHKRVQSELCESFDGPWGMLLQCQQPLNPFPQSLTRCCWQDAVIDATVNHATQTMMSKVFLPPWS